MTSAGTAWTKPLPEMTGLHARYWQGAREGKLLLQQCRECGTTWHQGSGFCPNCLAVDFDWTPASGTGSIYARIFMHQVYWPSFADDVPYNLVWVELDDGPMMTADIVDAPREDIEIGCRVEVIFDPVTPEVTIPRFRLV